jgi:2-polyprenyl-3-methyl-5-hydroxy-6-metoxy-1,4-benzoquinol methylase
MMAGARETDVEGWNYGSAWPPSYGAFGRLRVLTTLERVLLLKPRRVLEVAAGDGALGACLAEYGIKVVVNDLRAEILNSAIANYLTQDRISVVSGNLFDLNPEKTGLFDLIVATEVLEHLAHTEEFLHHLGRFLTPGGNIFLTTPNGSYFRNTLPTYSTIVDFESLEAEQFKPDADGHLFLITSEDLTRITRSAGLRLLEIDFLATPFITGHCGLSFLNSRRLARLFYWFEAQSRHLPVRVRKKICFSMSAILTKI